MPRTSCCIVVLAALILAIGPARGAIPSTERQALIAFYTSTNGDGCS